MKRSSLTFVAGSVLLLSPVLSSCSGDGETNTEPVDRAALQAAVQPIMASASSQTDTYSAAIVPALSKLAPVSPNATAKTVSKVVDACVEANSSAFSLKSLYTSAAWPEGMEDEGAAAAAAYGEVNEALTQCGAASSAQDLLEARDALNLAVPKARDASDALELAYSNLGS